MPPRAAARVCLCVRAADRTFGGGRLRAPRGHAPPVLSVTSLQVPCIPSALQAPPRAATPPHKGVCDKLRVRGRAGPGVHARWRWVWTANILTDMSVPKIPHEYIRLTINIKC
ncbi:hypothetical protein GGX14DRAFT_404346 [Mycena pura]|uniref:Uncharacterized protein n=1 Tax=Mycena pura TaxID=153505 RepID=A0AAD6Y3P1_9AGAR|nr:hypothetical protein GGX14DRAFT_404346 [Mycena pura]